jgi:hypothetical protein
MNIYRNRLLLLVCFSLFFCVNGSLADEKKSVPSADKALFGNAQRIGRLGDDRLVECSGMEISLTADNLIWAINDNGHGPFLYALRIDGRSMGRVLVFNRKSHNSWAAALSGHPETVHLPLPQDQSDFRQREAICFMAGSRALLITSEGHGAGIYRLETR